MDLEQYFLDQGLTALVEASKATPLGVNDMVVNTAYKPELSDLYFLHSTILSQKRTTVLEFGCGWSSLVMAHALRINAKKHDLSGLRRNNPFELHSVDDAERWIDTAKERLLDYPNAHVYYSPVHMTMWNGRIATEYETLPFVSPDFIYLDGPDQFDVRGDVNGFSTRHKDMMPMACDILKIEWFLTPGTIIAVDGRTANARFLKANFQRPWTHTHADDRHVFVLDEEPLGKHNANQIAFYKSV